MRCMHAFNHFAGPEPRKRIKSFRSDNARIKFAAKELGIVHITSTPERSQTNSKAERKIRHVLEGARCSLFQSGLPLCFWNFAGEHFCHAENIRRQTLRWWREPWAYCLVQENRSGFQRIRNTTWRSYWLSAAQVVASWKDRSKYNWRRLPRMENKPWS